VPLAAVALYLQLGNRAAIRGVDSASVPPAATASSSDAASAEQRRVEGNVAALAKRLEQNPNDAAGWQMLANSYTTMEKYSEASAAFAKATALKPDDADLLASYAFALAMANGRRLAGQPAELLRQALKVDPENPKALQLAGSAAYEARNYQGAVTYWVKLQQKTPPDSELGRALVEQIAEARKLAGQK
jgi:cytochrome c-type biogenesis protein CcmH